MKSFTGLLIASLLLTASFANADESAVSTTALNTQSLPSVKTFRIEPTVNASQNGSGEGVYFSYGGNFSFKTGVRRQQYTKSYFYSSYTNGTSSAGNKDLDITYLEVPFFLNMESADSRFYSHMGLFYAMPQSATYGGQDAASIVQSNFNFQVEVGVRWQFKPLALKVGLASTAGITGITNDKSWQNASRSDSALTAGLSFAL
jgi:hypothetical protein